MTVTPVLWLSGAPGAGKTTVAWALYRELTREGLEVGYVDIDQINMCYPEPANDPGRFRLAENNLAAVVAGFRTAGARAVIVSGCADPGRDSPALPNIALTRCGLRADPEVLHRRLVARRADPAFIAAAMTAPADQAGPSVDTTGLTVDEVVAEVRNRTAGWMDRTGPAQETERRTPADGPILWVCGPTGVGKSTAGFDFYLRHVLGAYVDLGQLGFFHRADDKIKAGILAALWRNFRDAGAEHLTIVGRAVNINSWEAYAKALPFSSLTVCRLQASAGELTRRIMLRREGGPWAEPGDALRNQPLPHLEAIAAKAVSEAAALDRAALGARGALGDLRDLRIDTDGQTPAQTADEIARRRTLG
ncbi:AAA family ATPase [Actinoplanes sp. GCM10030250]|uniref:AAA family ATPase n=1 Tax=Actinoplanes sp. GCM10030250 TaxID=3273376 RepID=UPI0036238082